MKALYNWLKEFVPFEAAPDELRARLSLAGIPVDAVADSPAGPVLDVELFMNRPDCMGHLGLAREVSALYRAPLKTPKPRPKEAKEKAEAATRVEIECPDLCGRFTARVIRGLKVAPSPDWLRQKLEALGQQSINNVVDATNYVMLELGHPLHAFDLDELAERRIVVRRARPGEKIRTLDGVERKLSPEMCMVCDAARAQGVGGVMGGSTSEISLATKNVLLECAWFDPVSIRRTAKALGLRTEASTRFERGMDPEMAEPASRRCAELVLELAGGELLAGLVDAYPQRPAAQKIELTRRELLRVMGADIPDRDVEEILTALGFAPVRTDAHRASADSLVAAWECTRPTWRVDVARDTDLIEEVARHYGFEKFPARLPPARQPAQRLPHAPAGDALRERLAALGYDEIITIPMADAARDRAFALAPGDAVAISNPMAEDASVMRRSGVVSMLGALEGNLNRGNRNVRLCEFGRRYSFVAGQPVETLVLTLGATGLAQEKTVHADARAYSFADLKGDLDAIGELAGGLRWEAGGPEWLHPARAATVFAATNGPAPVGVAGQLTARAPAAAGFKLRQEVFIAELELEPLWAGQEARRAALRYAPLPRFPAVERDFSLLLVEGTPFAAVRQAIAALGIAEIVSVEAVDLFRGGQVPAGKYSLLVRVIFQSPSATLTDAEVNGHAARLVAALEEKLGASLRA